MKLIFGALAIFAVAMILIAGSGVFFLTSSALKDTKQEAVKALASGVAYNISSQIQLYEKIVAQMAADQDVIAAIESADPVLIENTATKMQKLLPVALKVRLLLPTVNVIDDRFSPVMGYADLQMVKKTLNSPQHSIIQGEDKNRHLAVTAVIKKQGRVLGVVLASLKFDFLATTLKESPVEQNFISVEQESIELGKTGNPGAKGNSLQSIEIPNSPWTLSFAPAEINDLAHIVSVIVLVIFLAGLMVGALFFGHRYMSSLLKKDQDKVLEAVKNLMIGKGLGSYQLRLSEMQVIISTLVQFKRILDNKSDHAEEEHGYNKNTIQEDLPEKLNEQEEPVEEERISNSLFKKKTVAKPIAEAKPKAKPKLKPQSPSKAKTAALIPMNPETPVHIDSPTPEVKTKATAKTAAEDIFKAYDIRGIVGKGLTKETVYDIGLAFGSEAKLKGVKKVVVARDGRLSGPDLNDCLIRGIISTGRHVLDVGMVPTPVLYFVTQHTEGRTGIMLTGSHNPANYNGLKMVMQGETLANEKIQQLKQRIAEEDFITEAMGSVEQNDGYYEEYIGTICDDIRLDKSLKVVVDCGNGVAGKLAPELLMALGCEVIELFCEIDGNFPNHHPDPSKPENLKDLIAAVAKHKADIGLAFDGDGDRLGVIDSEGKIIWADRQMMLYAKQVLSLKSGAEIIYDVKCSRHLGEQIKKYGGHPVMWKTGHSLMKAKLKETGAALAGEMSGHIFFNDRWFGFDDALYTAARLLEILSADSRSSSQVFAEFPDSINTPELNVSLAEGENFTFMAELIKTAHFPDATVIDIDGLRVDFKDGWGLVRASNTTPSLVIRFEADTQHALEKIQQQFALLMTDVKSDIKLPF